MHTIMHDFQLLLTSPLVELDQLSHIARPREIEHKVVCHFGVCLIEMLQIVGFHVGEIKDVPICIARPYKLKLISTVILPASNLMENIGASKLTTPRRTSENNSILRRSFQPHLQRLKDIPLNPEDLLSNPVDLRIMFRAGESFGVLFYREDLFPSAGEGEGYYVSACSCEGVYEDCF